MHTIQNTSSLFMVPRCSCLHFALQLATERLPLVYSFLRTSFSIFVSLNPRSTFHVSLQHSAFEYSGSKYLGSYG